jgi:Tol biopolymer transport system component
MKTSTIIASADVIASETKQSRPSMKGISMRARITSGLLASLLPAALLAQGPRGPGGAGGPPPKPLPLEVGRHASFSASKGTWISLDVSPDGRTIVFDLLGDLYTLPIEGGTATRITSGMAYDAQPRFSPDGKKVAFVSDRSGGDNLWILSLDLKDTTQLTQGNGNLHFSPRWAPDGKYVVDSRSPGLGGAAKLQMYHVDGGGGLGMMLLPAGLKGLGPAFTPDGRYIWFAARNGDWQYNAVLPQYELARYDRQTGESSRMTVRYGSAFRPELSPDGKWLVYGTRYHTETGLVIRELASGEERWLAYPVQRDEQESRAPLDVLPGYAFTPDSRSVVASYGGEIWRIPVDGGAAAKIPFTAEVKLDIGPEVKFSYRVDTAAALTARQIRNPVASPDGKRVVFTALDRLYVADLPSGTPRRLDPAEVGQFHPAWSPDGQSVAYVTWGDAAGGQIMKVAAAGGPKVAAPVALTRTPAMYYNLAWSPTGSRIVATRGTARDYREVGNTLGGEFVWVPATGGDAVLIAPSGTRDVAHFTSDTSRIYAYSPVEGLVSFRWDGTDVKQHLRVTGVPGVGGGLPGLEGDEGLALPRRLGPFFAEPDGPPREGAQGPPPAGLVLMAPKGDLALVQAGTDVYTVTVPQVGGPVPSTSVSGGPVPIKRLTDIGGEFPSWGATGRMVHWGMGNAFVSYDLDKAKVVEDSLKVIDRAKADSTRRAGARADSLKTLQATADSLRKASAAVPDSIQSRINTFKADSAHADSAKKSVDKAKADSTKLAAARTDSLKMLNARADSIKKAGGTVPDSIQSKILALRADSTKRVVEKPGYKPDELRLKVTVPRDAPKGTVVLRGGRAVTMKGKEIIENADIVVKDNRIIAVGKRGEVKIPGGARIVDVTGKTVLPGFVDTHYHAQGLIWEIHPAQHWEYLTTLAYGVTTTRDPQTQTTDVLSYQDRVESGGMLGPRVYSTGPGVGIPDGENIRDLDHARAVLKRYSQYWDTKTLKMYMAGNRQQRQWIIMAAKELGIMPTTEGGLDFKLELTHAMDGYPGVEHALPIAPIFNDVVELFKASQTTNTPTLLVSYGGPFGENYYYATEDVHGDPKLRHFFPEPALDTRTRRRGTGSGGSPGPGGWFRKEEYVFPKHAEFAKHMIEAGARIGIGSHGQLQGLGYHWELWSMASGGMTNHDVLRAATIYGAEAIGMGADLGSLEAGKMADIVVLDANPLENIRNSNSVRYVMKNGRIYEGNTLNEIWPRQRVLAPQYWQEGMPKTVAGIH